MDNDVFKQRVKPLNVAKRKVEAAIEKFSANNVTVADLPTFRENLKDIRDKSETFEELLFDLLEDLDKNNPTDNERITSLTNWHNQLTADVVKNENGVKEKIVSLQENKSLSGAEKKAKETKEKKLDIDMESFKAKCESLVASISSIKDAKDLSDQDVKQFLLDCKSWESKIETIEASKVAIDKESVGLDVDRSKLGLVSTCMDKLRTIFKSKKEDLTKADTERCLYSLCKGVKELAIYPDVFSGKESEDIFDFKEKMVDALRTNQIREKDKITVLRKYLKGEAKDMIGQHYEKFDDAMNALMDHFGLAQKTWEFKVKDFVNKCKKPDIWRTVGTRSRQVLIGRTCEFIREAEKLSKSHPSLKSTIISHSTIGTIFSIIPETVRHKVIDLGTGPTTTVEIKSVLEKLHNQATEKTLYAEQVQERCCQPQYCCQCFK